MQEIRFRVNGEMIGRKIKTPKSSFDVIYDLMKEFGDFDELNFKVNDKWVYGAVYDNIIKTIN